MKKERSADFKGFMDWMNDNHGEIKKHIERNDVIALELRNILEDSFENILEKLEKLDRLLASFSMHFEPVCGLAKALTPNYGLSDQAISILKQFVYSKGITMQEMDISTGIELYIMESHEYINIEDRRLLRNDLKRLVESVFLIPGINSAGKTYYNLGENGIKFIKSL